MGGTITRIIMTYYYGFLFYIIVNSIIWFVISTVVNKYYWHYRDEMALASKYIFNRKRGYINNILNFKYLKLISFKYF
jgi:hypothetical protein